MSGEAKKRLDVLIFERGLTESREKAQALIMAGVVSVNGRPESKAGTKFPEACEIEIKENPLKYVSRGGLKLEKAIETWAIDIDGKICMDVGASTGGFTDLLLHSGAKKVYAIDVGYGQLDWKLRNDERVCNMERTNFRHLDPATIADRPWLITIDVSFISLKHIFPVAAELLDPDGRIVALIKPQFEAERSQVGKNGIIRDEKIHKEVIEKVRLYAAENSMTLAEVTESPITGAKGNREFLGLIVGTI
jgi:23S rRNA (cytidine1920-2'-O)/16S rRNA (cytidine1409-2'-O)-methyltransferase